MSDRSAIQWTDATWAVTTGCDHVSPGCNNCYAARLTSGRLAHLPEYAGLAVQGRFTGEVRLHPQRLDYPLRWRKPRRVFVCSMSDLFHKDTPDEFIARTFGVIAASPRHTFQVLTKRPARMRSLLSNTAFVSEVVDWAAHYLAHYERPRPDRGRPWDTWPIPNLWLGVSVEDQHWAGIRIPVLLDTPAAVRFVSAEPLLGPVDLSPWMVGTRRLDWVITGGESGPGARPVHPAWLRNLHNQCVAAGVPFFLKQWGEWAPAEWKPEREDGETVEAYKARAGATGATHAIAPSGHVYQPPHKPWSTERRPGIEPHAGIRRVGKHAAGRELDGRAWDEYPEVTQ